MSTWTGRYRKYSSFEDLRVNIGIVLALFLMAKERGEILRTGFRKEDEWR